MTTQPVREFDALASLAEVSPALIEELLPPKIAHRKKLIGELALELDLMQNNPFASEEGDIAPVRKALMFHTYMLEAYEKRLQATRDAASGK